MKLFILLITITFFSDIANCQIAAYDSVPVRLSFLEARRTGNDARLDWKVVCFLDYAKFEIQRSPNGYNYATIKAFEADQLRCRQPFDFTDAGITGKTFYRIRVGDINGKFYHSKIVAITGKEKGFEINSLTPSIVTSNATLSISAAAADVAEIVIANLQGAVVKRLNIKLNRGVTDVPINTDRLAKGNYIVTVTNGIAEVKTARFSKL